MKSVIAHLAQQRPQMDLEAFRAAYVAQHPTGGSLTPDNIRQGFSAFNKYVRQARRNHEKQTARK